MSASREKNARKDPVITKSTQELRNQQDAKNDRNFYIKCIVAVAALAIAFILCFLYGNDNIRKNMTAVTVDGEKFSAAEVDFYYRSTVDTYSQYFSYLGVDPNKDLDSQKYDETQSWGDFLRDAAVNSLHQTAAMYHTAVADGYTLDEQSQKELDDYSASIDTYCSENAMTRDQFLQTRFGDKMTNEIFMKHTEMMFVASAYMAEQKADTTYSEEELTSYYNEHKADIDRADYEVLTINADYSVIEGYDAENPPEDGYTDAQTKEATEAAHEKALALQKRAEAGESLEALGKEIGDRYYSSKTNASFADYTMYAFNEWVFDDARTSGEIGLVEDTEKNTYYIVKMNQRYRPEYSTVNAGQIFFPAANSGLQPGQEGYEEALQLNLAKAQEDAETALNKYRSGSKSFEEFAAEMGAQNSMMTQLTRGSGKVAPEVDLWLFNDARTVGDTDTIATANGYALVSFEGTDVPAWQVRCSEGLYNQWAVDIYENAPLKTHTLGLKAVK